MSRLALALLFLAPAAFAEPATIKVFEAKVYEKPDATSAVVHAFIENAQVSVSETPENGFRKVRLPDGKIGYVEESSLALGAARPSDAPLAATAPKPTIYVKDFYHLATLVKDDKEVAPMAGGLVIRRNVALGVGLGGMLTGIAVATLGFVVIPQECNSNGYCHYGSTTFNMLYVGLSMLVVAPMASMLLLPSRNDFLDVINKWNTRHPDDQFVIDRASSK